MNRTELRESLEKHLDFLKQAAKEAADLDHYSEAAELSKQILETVKLLNDENAPQNTVEQKERTAWETPRLSMDKDGFWLGDVHLPVVTRFCLKNSPSNNGIFTLDMELEVTL